jgi:hypothetical protein
MHRGAIEVEIGLPDCEHNILMLPSCCREPSSSRVRCISFAISVRIASCGRVGFSASGSASVKTELQRFKKLKTRSLAILCEGDAWKA